MSDTTPRWDDDYQALLTFIGHMCEQLQELAKQVGDEELRAKLLDLADQCGGEFFGGIFKTTDRRTDTGPPSS